ncbi:cytochrome P450 [Desarmillaria tabescens]|uniref:Cytochrome P450 n=1 Tax=Armillaria tabescens TaxID=1929756 RepID=A0AA39JYJ3_ARMTA|nr:cytochrome P450 [Desarmillaria tabescens]KAK0448933.1 cytochrome P450 [Desarmillaria tabescens]
MDRRIDGVSASLADTLWLFSGKSLMTLACSWLAIVVFYRFYFHPLAKFPGPKLAAVSSLYHFYYDVVAGGEMLSKLAELHKVYGPVVRYGPNSLHFSERLAYSDIYRTGTNLTKEPFFYKCFYFTEASFGFTDPQKHKTRREMMAPFFHRRAVLRLESVVQTTVDKLISRLSENADEPVDFYFAFRAVALEVIATYCFGQSFGSLDVPGFRHQLLLNIAIQIQILWVWKWFPLLPVVLMNLPDFIILRLDPTLRANLDLRDMLTKQIDNFVDNEDDLKNAHEVIYHHLLHPSSEKHTRPSKSSLHDEAMLLIEAGSDTVGNACYTGMFYALNDPYIYKKVTAELQESWADRNQPMPLQSLEKLPYLTAFIKESLRLSHGVVTALPRVVQKATRISDYAVPAGVDVSMAVSFVHLDPEVFKDPLHFNPDRWLVPNAHELENSLVAFSRGTRMCAGINLAWAELYLILGNVFRKLDLKIYDGARVEEFAHFKEYFVPVHRGQNLKAHVAKQSG